MPTGGRVAVIPIHGVIYNFTLKSLKIRTKRALDAGASILVFEMNTPGGVVTSALDICHFIKTLPVPTIAWVHDEAYSGGILVASACDRIIMSPASAVGDCAPIVPGRSLAPTERAKALSPILAQFRENARDNGYDYTIFHAMCVLGVEVYQVQNIRTGERRLVNQLDYQVMVKGADPDAVSGAKPQAAGAGPQAATVAGPTLHATDADRGQWRLIQRVHDGQTLLTLYQTKAQQIGLSQGIVANLPALKQYLGASSVHTVPRTWSSNLAEFLVNPIVRGILLIAVLVGAYFEFQAPGVGIGGAVAAAGLLLLLGAPFLVGLASVWHIILFLIGLVLLMIELFFIPGFGFVGVTGLVLMFIGLVLSIVPTAGGQQYGPIRLPPPEMWNRVMLSGFYMMAGLLVSLIIFAYMARHFGRLPLFNRLILTTPDASGVAASAAMNSAAPGAAHTVAVGRVGNVISPLRPGGTAQFDGHMLHVVSLGNWIEVGRPVKIVEVRGNRVVVDEVNV